MMKKVRVLIAKMGLDGHTTGAIVVTRALRDAGMEVIYTGLRQTPEMVVQAAIQEDVDVIGISTLSGAHMKHFPKVVNLLKKQGADDKLVIGGGVIPREDLHELEKLGVSGLFTMGTPTSEIVEFIRSRFGTES